MLKRKKMFIIIGVAVLFIIIVIANLKRDGGGKGVNATIAKRSNIVSRVRADGTLKALNQVQIGSDVMGRIVEIRVNEGKRIHKGDVLCIIEQSTYLARFNQAKASLNLAKARMNKAEEDLKHTEELFTNKLISREEYEREKLAYETVKAEYVAALESYNEAMENYNRTIITSPVDGEVVQINKEEGEMAIVGTINTPGSIIMTIAERSKMFVKALVDEIEIVKIEAGQPVTIKIDAFPDTIFNGNVTKIGGIPEKDVYSSDEAVNFPIEVEISGSPERLYPGMSASCEITVDVKDSVVVIPYTALGRKKIKDTETDIVFLADGRKARIVSVKLGITGEKGIEIQEGIGEGDTVLIGPYKTLRKLKDGDRIEVRFEKIPEKEKKGRLP